MKAQSLMTAVLLAASGALSAGAIRSESGQPPEVATRTAASTGNSSGSARKPVSAGIADVLKMAERGVDSSVIKSFVETYPVAYNPSADEIIALHDAGISSDTIAALLRHSSELRSKQMETAARMMAQRIEATRSAPVAQATAPAATPQPAAPTSQVTYVYPAYTYPTYYPAYSYSYGWPLYYSSSYCYRPFRYSYYSYWPRSYGWRSWPSWPSYGVRGGFHSGHFGRPGFGFHSFPRHSSRFACR